MRWPMPPHRLHTGTLDMSDEATSILLKRAKFVVAALVALLLLGGVTVLVNRSMQARALADATAIHSMQYVTTTQPTGGGDGMAVTLPGTLQGVIESTVYARSRGYLSRLMKGLGPSVKKCELLAE